ncbi:L-fucose kinase [Geodia barretti]|nr:L-fucose kinase [Geodia barretti]
MTADIEEEEFVSGQSRAGPAQQSSAIMRRARTHLWNTFSGTKMRAVHLVGVQHDYLRHVAADVCNRYLQSHEEKHCVINSRVQSEATIGDGSVLINCNIQHPIVIGANCFLSGVTNTLLELQAADLSPVLSVPDGIALQEIRVTMGTAQKCFHLDVGVVYGINDLLTASEGSEGATFCNRPWSEFFERTKIQSSELWPTTPHNLLTAKLYVASHTHPEATTEDILWLAIGSPSEETLLRWRSAWRVSLMDILRRVDSEAEFKKGRDIAFQLQLDRMVAALKNNELVCFLSFFKQSLVENRQHDLFATLDHVVEEVLDKPLVICRTYACIADILGYMAGEVGIRGGPAANIAWRMAFNLLEKEDYLAATRALAAERKNWTDNGPDRIIRASRHYERAGHIITRMGVATAKKFISGTQSEPPPIGQPVTVTAPARIDIAGGWTDTPPQAYEWGGVVVTLAIKINDEKPIKCTATRIEGLKLVLVQCGSEGQVVERIEVTDLSHMLDYSQPHAPGALMKAAFVCAGVVEVRSSQSLAEQLSKYGGGFELTTISNIPQGSGLGTSSILGGAIMAALWRATGQQHTKDSLIHAVLYLEQLLTTGGGWQDQCGGMYGGAKISKSEIGLPVKISTQEIETPDGFLAKLNEHLMLIYTGRTRLARNLLQDVLRNWHSREARIIQTMTELVANAEKAADAIRNGDLAVIGDCLTKYGKQKVVMAPGSLPQSVQIFIKKAQNHIHGCSLAGAGGGGFLVAIAKSPDDRHRVEEIVNTSPELKEFKLYSSCVDRDGLVYQ